MVTTASTPPLPYTENTYIIRSNNYDERKEGGRERGRERGREKERERGLYLCG